MTVMSPEAPTDYAALGAALRRVRDGKRLTRAQVADAGGPSASTIQRIEDGKVKTEIDAATKEDLEKALGLPPSWIDDFLAGRVTATTTAEPEPVVIEGNGERVLVAITAGVAELSLVERKAVLALVRALQGGPEH